MLARAKEHLGVKLFVILAAVVVMAVAPLTYSALHSLKDYGAHALALHSRQIRTQTLSSLQTIVRERAAHYQNHFDRIAASAGLLAAQASAIYDQLPFYGSRPYHNFSLTPSAKTGNFVSSPTDPVVAVYWGDSRLSPEIRQEVGALSHMFPLFRRVLRENPEVLASHSITTSGIGLYFTARQHYRQAAREVPPASVFDLRDGEPMTVFTRATEPLREVRWTDVYKDDVTDGFMLTASAPVYDETGRLRGITGIDVPLDTIIGELLTQTVGKEEKHQLLSFLIDETGKIIAFPPAYYPLFGIDADPREYANSSDRLNLSLSHSTSEAVRRLSGVITSGGEHQVRIRLGDEIHYVVSSKMSDHPWIFGMVISEREMLKEITAGRKDLNRSVRNMASKSVFFSLLTIAIAVAVIFLLLRHLITPLRRLAQATRQVAAGDFDVQIPVLSKDEPGILADSFNSMVIQLRTAQKQQRLYSDYLENEIHKRSEQILRQKQELERTVAQLREEIERRKIISEALQLSRQKYYDTLESTKAGVYIIEDFLLTYVNTSFAETIFRSSKDELIGRNPLSLVCEEDRGTVEQNIKLRLRGLTIPPYTIRCRRPDGSTFYGEVWSKSAVWRDKAVMVGTITDVTTIQQKEAKLREQEQKLQQSLQEKEMLLREIYHRTKNNMLIIISMLELKRHEIEDENQRDVFREMENRIRSMAIVHEKLYTSQDLNKIDMAAYLSEVARTLISSMILDDRITLELQAEDITIDIDHAIPVGLVSNEIITNAIKHAFPDGRQGKISISITMAEDDHILLTIADNGIGLPEDVDILRTSSFGTGIIIAGLVQMQLRGQISVERDPGTRYTIRFLDPIQHKRL